MSFKKNSFKYKKLVLSLLLIPAVSSAQVERLEKFEVLKEQHPKVFDENLEQVIQITGERTPTLERQAKADNVDLVNKYPMSLGPKLNEALGGVAPYWQAPNLLNFGANTYSLANYIAQFYVNTVDLDLKERYHYPRPIVVSDKITLVPGFDYSLISLTAAFPSGHTANGYGSALLLAQIFPERYAELMTAAADFGQSRILLGVHYPLDIIGSRMVVESQFAALMSHPLYRVIMRVARAETRARMALSCGGNLTACLEQNPPEGKRYQDSAANAARFNERMGYKFTRIGDLNYPFHTPEKAGWLLLNRFPYLTDFDRKNIIASTADPAGNPLDDQTGGPSWQRVNLYKAAHGPARLDYDLTVNMNGSIVEKMISGWSNPYYSWDSWANAISGTGSITKKGRGTLLLTGDLDLRRFEVASGTLGILGENNYFADASLVERGTLVLGGAYHSAAPLVVGSHGTLLGAGIMHAPLVVAGRWTLTGNAPFTAFEAVTLAPEARLEALNLADAGALLAEGGGATIHLNGILDAQHTLPGALIATKKGAHVEGDFARILNPRNLWGSPYYYSLLKHDRGVNVYLNSDRYPDLSALSGRALEGAVLLTRLQGNRSLWMAPQFQNWLFHALNTGDMGTLPELVTGSVYADAVAAQLTSVQLLRLNLADAEHYQVGKTYFWAEARAGQERNDARDGFASNEINSEHLSFGINQLVTPKLIYSVALGYGKNRLTTMNAKAKYDEFSLSQLGQYHFGSPAASGAYINWGSDYRYHSGDAHRDLLDFGATRADFDTLKMTQFGGLGYRLKQDTWSLEPSLRYVYSYLKVKKAAEKGSVLGMTIPRQHFSSNFLEGRLDWYQHERKEIGDSGWNAGANAALVYQATFRNKPLALKAAIGSTEFRTVSLNKDKNKALARAGINFKRQAHQVDFSLAYAKSRHAKQGEAALKYSYLFE